MNIPSPSLNGLGTLIFPENIFSPKPVHQFSRSPGLQEKPGQIKLQNKERKKKKKFFFLRFLPVAVTWQTKFYEKTQGLEEGTANEEVF